MSFASIDNMLWGLGFIGHLALLAVMFARRRVRAFPVFTSLLAYQAIETVALFLISRYGNARTYYIGYWTLSLGDYVLQIALILEIGRNVLGPTGSWIRDAKSGFLLWSALGTSIALILSLAVTLPGLAGIDLWSARATVFTSLLTCEVFLAMSAAANRLGLPWGSHVMALGEGLTVWAISALVSNLVHMTSGWKGDLRVFDHVEMIVYLGALAFWIIAFWRTDRRRAPLSAAMQDYLVALHRRVEYDLDSMKSVDRPPL